MAANTFQFDIQGGKEAEEALLEIGSVLGTKAAKAALKKAMLPMLQEVIDTAPINTNVISGSLTGPNAALHLRDNIKLKISGRTNKHRKSGSDTFLVGTIYTTPQVSDYACAVEFGRAAYVAERTQLFGKSTRRYKIHIGAVPPNPFMRNALYKMYQSVTQNVITGIMDEIGKISANRNKIAQQKINAMYRRSAKLAP